MPSMRTTSSTMSAAPSTSRRQLGTGIRPAIARATTKPRRSRIACCRSAGDGEPAERLGAARGSIVDRALLERGRRAGADDAREAVAAALLDHQRGRDRSAVVEERRIDPALEPAARVAGQAELLAGPRDLLGIEIGAFDQHVGGRLGDARMLAAHDAADVVDRLSSAITVIVASSV